MTRCNLDCFNCPYDDCINDGEIDSSIRSANWYEKNKERKKAYQREYNKNRRQKNELDLTKKEKVCAVCGKKISIFDSRKKYCSVECQMIAKRQYEKQYQATHREELNKYRREYIREIRRKESCKKKGIVIC